MTGFVAASILWFSFALVLSFIAWTAGIERGKAEVIHSSPPAPDLDQVRDLAWRGGYEQGKADGMAQAYADQLDRKTMAWRRDGA